MSNIIYNNHSQCILQPTTTKKGINRHTHLDEFTLDREKKSNNNVRRYIYALSTKCNVLW